MESQSLISNLMSLNSLGGTGENSMPGGLLGGAESPPNGLFLKQLGLAINGVGSEAEGATLEGMMPEALALLEGLTLQPGGQGVAINGNPLPLMPQVLKLHGGALGQVNGLPLAMAPEEGVDGEVTGAAPEGMLLGANPLLGHLVTTSAVQSEHASAISAVDAGARQAAPMIGTPVLANRGGQGGLQQGSQAATQTVDVEGMLTQDTSGVVVDKSAKSDQLMAELSRSMRQGLMGAKAGEASPLSTSGQFSADTALSSLQLASLGVRDGALSTTTPTNTAMPRFMSTMDVPLNDSRWQGDFSNRVVWYAKSGVQHADIKMNPAHLGQVEVRISMNDDQQASVTFFAKNGAVREAIEASMPRLREMLSAQGMDLADSSVSEHSLNEQREQHSQQTNGFNQEGEVAQQAHLDEQEEGGVADPVVQVASLDSSQTVDYYV